MVRERLISQTWMSGAGARAEGSGLSEGAGVEGFAEFGEVVDADDVDDEAAAGAEAFVGVFADAGDFAAAAGDEDGVGVGQLVAGFGGAAEDGVHVRDAEAFGVLPDEAVVFGVHFDGEDLAVGRHLGRFDAHRAAAGADVPDDARRGDVHLGERDRADFGRRQQALLGLRLQERFVGVAEQAAADGFARAVGGVRRRGSRIITLSESNFCAAISASVPRVTRSSRAPRFSQT